MIFVARDNEDGLPYAFDSPFCNTSAKFSPTKMPKAISWFLLLLYEHKSLAYMIAEMELENQFSVLPMSLLLVCAKLLSLMLCCNRLFMKQAIRPGIARPLCDGRPFASSPVRRWAGRGLFFSSAASFFGGNCNLCSICADVGPYMTKCLVVGKWTQTQCSGPCGTLTCDLHIAI